MSEGSKHYHISERKGVDSDTSSRYWSSKDWGGGMHSIPGSVAVFRGFGPEFTGSGGLPGSGAVHFKN